MKLNQEGMSRVSLSICLLSLFVSAISLSISNHVNNTYTSLKNDTDLLIEVPEKDLDEQDIDGMVYTTYDKNGNKLQEMETGKTGRLHKVSNELGK